MRSCFDVAVPTAPVQRSLDDLGAPLADTVFCVLDLETTGTDRTNDTITEIGVVKVRGGECIGTYQTLVNPGRAIPPTVSVLTGLTDAIVSTAPRIEAVLGSLMEFLGDAVFVGHNVGFDLAFLRAALARDGRPRYEPTVVDTVALARRLVRDEVPDCRLATLASRFRLDHRPSHRALDDALATTDLLHLLIERAAGLGVLGLDDLVALAKLAGHPQAAKLALTATLPRAPGVYMFRGNDNEVLYVGKATNLRQRVRSYFGSEDRRKVGPMLRETRAVDHLELPDPLTAEVVEQRLIARASPRYNRAGTRADRYCYVRLDDASPWPRLSIVREPHSTGTHLGPLPSRAMAGLVVDAIESAVPLRRCSTRISARYVAPAGAAPCGPAQLGTATCPCAGLADPAEYRALVDIAARTLRGDTSAVSARLVEKMTALASGRRYEEAALVRDRLAALLGAARRHHLVEALRSTEQCEIRSRGVTWVIDRARLVDVAVAGRATPALPVEPPDPVASHLLLGRHQIDEALCLARHLERHAAQIEVVRCSGTWPFPIGVTDALPTLDRAALNPAA
jgi:DNA polymerase III subunit epsilon